MCGEGSAAHFETRSTRLVSRLFSCLTKRLKIAPRITSESRVRKVVCLCEEEENNTDLAIVYSRVLIGSIIGAIDYPPHFRCPLKQQLVIKLTSWNLSGNKRGPPFHTAFCLINNIVVYWNVNTKQFEVDLFILVSSARLITATHGLLLSAIINNGRWLSPICFKEPQHAIYRTASTWKQSAAIAREV